MNEVDMTSEEFRTALGDVVRTVVTLTGLDCPEDTISLTIDVEGLTLTVVDRVHPAGTVTYRRLGRVLFRDAQ